MKDFLYLIKREFRHFYQSKVAMLVFIGAPLFFGLIIGFVYQKADVSELPLVIVDLDNTQLSRKVIDALDDNIYVQVSKVVHQEVDGRQLFESGFVDGVVTIPQNFSADINQKRYPELQVDINTLNILTANYLTRGIQMSMMTMNAGIEIESLVKKGMPLNIALTQFESFKINIDRYYNQSANYLQFLWPGVICAIMQQVILLVVALVFSQEFEKRTFKTLLNHSRSTLQIIFVKMIPYVFLSSLLWFSILYLMFPYFKIPVQANFIDLFLLSELFIISLVCFGIMVSVIFPKQLASTEVLMIIASPSFILSGYTWPISQMPFFVKCIANAIPLTHFVSGFRKLAYMDISLHSLHDEIQALTMITIVSLLIAWIILHFKSVAVRHEIKLIHVLRHPWKYARYSL